MNTKRKPTSSAAPAPDLLTPVVARLKELSPRDIDGLAHSCNASSVTIKNIRDGKGGPLGPSYHLVARLYAHLVTNPVAAAQ